MNEASKKVCKSFPHACPVCRGKGEIGPELAQYDALPKYDGTDVYSCHICSGQGIVWEYRECEEDKAEEGVLPVFPIQPMSTGIITQPMTTGIYPPVEAWQFHNSKQWNSNKIEQFFEDDQN